MDSSATFDEHVEEKISKSASDVHLTHDWANVIIDYIQDGMKSKDSILIGSILGAIVVIVTTIFFILRGCSSRRQNVLIIGLCNSGKTLLFSKFIHKTYVDTQTSIKENIGAFSASSTDKKCKNVTLIDIPGHDRVRQQFFEQFKSSARAIVFVIDSVTFQKELKDVAECMYNLLVEKFISQNALPVLVACNKQDQALAKGASVIRSALEKELNNVRITQFGSLQGVDGKQNQSYFLGNRKHDFTFADIRPASIEFLECSAKSEEQDGLLPIEKWLAKFG